MIENWNHGSGVGRFFPFSCKRGVSSSIAVVIRIGRKKRAQKKNGWMDDKYDTASFIEPNGAGRLQVQKPAWYIAATFRTTIYRNFP